MGDDVRALRAWEDGWRVRGHTRTGWRAIDGGARAHQQRVALGPDAPAGDGGAVTEPIDQIVFMVRPLTVAGENPLTGLRPILVEVANLDVLASLRDGRNGNDEENGGEKFLLVTQNSTHAFWRIST